MLLDDGSRPGGHAQRCDGRGGARSIDDFHALAPQVVMVNVVRFLLRLHEDTLTLLRFVHFLALSLGKGLEVQAFGVVDVIQLTCRARLAKVTGSLVFN